MVQKWQILRFVVHIPIRQNIVQKLINTNLEKSCSKSELKLEGQIERMISKGRGSEGANQWIIRKRGMTGREDPLA